MGQCPQSTAARGGGEPSSGGESSQRKNQPDRALPKVRGGGATAERYPHQSVRSAPSFIKVTGVPLKEDAYI